MAPTYKGLSAPSMGKLNFTPVHSGDQSLLASPLSETEPYPVASSPIPADQTSLQGQLSYDLLQPDPPVVVATKKECHHHATKLCQTCQSPAPA